MRIPPKTCELLTYLIENAGRILSKDELMDKVWEDTFVEEANLTQHISILRRVLGKEFIETIPRKGYRFMADLTAENSDEFGIEITKSHITQQICEEEIEIETLPNLLIGRAAELVELSEILSDQKTRLVTLTGTGGTGKTSLAKAIKPMVSKSFRDGVFFIDLSPITDANLVISVIAQSIGLKERVGAVVFEILKARLRESITLLILDNFEQIVDAASEISDLLENTSNLKILVTSRELLRLRNEREFIVHPLPFPLEKAGLTIEDIMNYPAVQLFTERAKFAKPTFALTEENVLTVAEICRKLEGIPLAIELAAARMRVLSLTDLNFRLQSQLTLLKNQFADLPHRQQTMRAAIHWSYDLLDDIEKRVFEGLSAFIGGFTLEAAEFIFELDAEDFDVLDIIERLVVKNLLTANETSGGGVRFGMLEAVKEFSLELLNVRGELSIFQKRHAEYFADLGRRADSELTSANQTGWISRLEEDINNLRKAINWLLANDADSALDLLTNIHLFLNYRSYFAEGRHWLEAAIEKSNDKPSSQLGRSYKALALLSWKQGDYETARRGYGKTLEIGEILNDDLTIATAFNGFAIIAYLQNEIVKARSFYEKALPLSRTINNANLIRSVLMGLGEIARIEEDVDSAYEYNQEVLALTRDSGDKYLGNGSLINLGFCACQRGEFPKAQAFFSEALKLDVELDSKAHILLCLHGFAWIATKLNNDILAVKLAAAAETLQKEIGYELETPDRKFRDGYCRELKARMGEMEFSIALNGHSKIRYDEIINLALNQ